MKSILLSQRLFFFIFILLTFNVYAQNDHKFVKLKEEKKGKRLSLYAINTDSISYDVFLRIETTDFRRSSKRPIIRTIAPNSKIKLATLIQLANSKSKYNATFIVNEVAYALKINKDFKALDFKLDTAINNKKVILFINNSCSICTKAKHILNSNKISYTEYNIDKDSTEYLKTIALLKNNKPQNKIPFLKIENTISSFNSIEGFITILRKAFN